MHDDEDADEEENGDPVDLVERLGDLDALLLLLPVMLDVVEQHQHRGAEQRYGPRLEAEGPGKDEAEHDEGDDGKRGAQERPVDNRRALAKRQDWRTRRRR